MKIVKIQRALGVYVYNYMQKILKHGSQILYWLILTYINCTRTEAYIRFEIFPTIKYVNAMV